MNRTGAPLNVAMLTPWRARCGISDYSHHLVEGLQRLPDIAGVQIVEPPERRPSLHECCATPLFAEERRFRATGGTIERGYGSCPHSTSVLLFQRRGPAQKPCSRLSDAIQVPLVMTVHEIALPPSRRPPVLRAALAYTNRANLLDSAHRARWMVHTTSDRDALCMLGRTRQSPGGDARRSAGPAVPDRDGGDVAGSRGHELSGADLFGFLSVKKGHDVALAALSICRRIRCCCWPETAIPTTTRRTCRTSGKIAALGLSIVSASPAICPKRRSRL